MKASARGWGTALLKLAAILLGGIALGFGLLLAAYALPTEPIAEHVKLSAQSLDGSWATGELPYEQLVKGYETTQLDNSTDALMLLAAAIDSDKPLVQRAVDGETATSGVSAFDGLVRFARGGQDELIVSTSARYWHGFQVYLKPLLCFFSYMDIRMLQMVFQLLLLCAVAAGLAKRGLARYAPAFALSLSAVTPAITGFSLQFSAVYTLFLLAMLMLLLRPRLPATRLRAAAFFMVVGMATCYFDYLTYPIATFGMPFLLFLLLSPAASRREALLRLLLCLGAWLAGYFGMWAGKWALALLFSGDGWFVPNLVAKITERASYASGGEAITVAGMLGRVLGVFAKKAYLLVAVAALAAYAALLLRALVKRARALSAGARPGVVQATASGQPLAFALTGLLPFGWYLLASNHSYNHAFFTSRATAVTVFAVCLLATLLLERIGGEEARKREN